MADNLGTELFLLMVNLSQLRDRRYIIRLFLEALSSLLTGIEFEYVAEAEPSRDSCLELATARRKLGHLTVNGPWDELAPDVKSLVRNSVAMLALILENLLQAEALAGERDRLELTIEERTSELRQANQVLRREIDERKKTEEELSASQEQYRRIVETANEGIWAIDGEFRTTFVNQRMADMLGYSVREMLGRRVESFMFSEDLEDHQTNMNMRRQGICQTYERRFRGKNGETVWTSISATALRDAEGNFGGSFAMLSDITYRKKAEEALRESEERFRLAMEATLDGLWDWDMTTNKVFRSPAFLSMIGCKTDQMPGYAGDWQDKMLPQDRQIVQDALTEYLAGQRDVHEVEFRVIRESGDVTWILSRGRVVQRDEIGRPLRMVGTHTDVTQRKRAEEALRESQEQLETIFQASPAAIFLVDSEGRVNFSNERMRCLFCLTSAELLGKPYVELVHPEERYTGRATMLALMAGEIDHVSVERRYLAADGTEFIGHLSGRRLTLPDGQLRGLLGIITDITDRKKAENEVIKERDRAQSYLDIAGVMMVVIDHEMKIVLANKKACSVLGLNEKEIIGQDWFETCLPQRDRESLKAAFSDLIAGKDEDWEYHENPVITKQGEERLIAWRNTLLRNSLGTIIGTLSSGEDITDRRRAEIALLESEERYRTLFDRAGDGIIVTRIEGDQAGAIVSANPAAAQMHGYTMEEFLSLSMSDLDTPEETKRMDAHFATIKDGNLLKTEHFHRRKDGTVISIELSAGPIEMGGEKYSLSINRDITQRKKAEAERLLLATAIEQAAESVEITDAAGNIVYVNPAFEKTTGYCRSEVIGLKHGFLASGEHDRAFYGKMWKTLGSGFPWSGNLINKKKDGTLFEEEVSISPVKDESGQIVNYVAVKRDVTSEILLQKQLLEAQKMEAVGTLAGGIAHDFNNLLQVISGFAEVALFDIPEGQRGHPELLEIVNAARSAAELTQGLLTFSRRVESKLRPVDLNQELERLAKMLRRTLPKMIKIEMNLSKPLNTVNADPAQLQQVIMNLAVNARDAMPKGGTLLIETINVYLDAQYCKAHLNTPPGNYVLMTISDSGTGMDERTRKHIFDPFFTTKETGKGTGLGLAIAFGIVKSHGGNLLCYSEPGHGTIFKIYLPAIAAIREMDETAHASSFPAGRETILLVDDEDSVRRLATQVLTRLGYTVINASNGKMGVEIFLRERNRIDLVILDLIMPEMGGRDCLNEIMKYAPDTKVIIASGYAANGQIDRALAEGARASLPKPYETKLLLDTVRNVLDGA